MNSVSIFWFRRDLRIKDNAALFHALKSGHKVLPIFIFDRNILDELPREDSRVTFIYEAIDRLKTEFQKLGSDLRVYYSDPLKTWKKLLKDFRVEAVYANEDYEPYAKNRDEAIRTLLQQSSVELRLFKDHVILDSSEVLKADGLPYTVFTPYKKKWLAKLNSKGTGTDSFYLKSYPSEKQLHNMHLLDSEPLIPLTKMGFTESNLTFPSRSINKKVVIEYAKNRDFPAIAGTTKLGLHYRFGTISIREKARSALNLSEVYLSELVWRDFYSQILNHFPHVVTESFRRKYDRIEWVNDKDDFAKWCIGQTGYPIVDAGMRELNATGYMHNRVRMIVASFLTKHLLIDWRWGEQYFASKLLDYDLASNNGGWQWAAGCGTDAAPYFRIFNPYTQQKKFDPEFKYVKKWVPEYGTEAYVAPIVDHKEARLRCLETYKRGLN